MDTSEGGEVGADTTFVYRQDGDLIWAEYWGGRIQLGFLVGIRRENQLEFRYAQVNHEGDTATGHCRSEIVVSNEDEIELHERWEWDSKPGSGTSVVREIPPVDNR